MVQTFTWQVFISLGDVMQISTDSFKYHIQNFNKDEFEQFLQKIELGQFNNKKLKKLFSKSIDYLGKSTYPDPKALYILELAKKTLQKMENAPETLQEQFFQVQHSACFKQFTDCPLEVDQYIFSFLGPQSLFRVYSVCKAFQTLAKELYEDTFALQKTILRTLFQSPESLPKLKYTAQLSLDFSHRDMSQAAMLVPSENGQLPLYTVFSNITDLNLHRLQGLPNGVTITTLLDQCNNLRSLQIEVSKQFCFGESPESILQSIAKKSELRKLTLSIFREDIEEQILANSLRFLLNSCSKLEELKLPYSLDDDFFTGFTDEANEGRIYPQIKSLSLNVTNWTAHQIAQFLTCFPNIHTLSLRTCENVEFYVEFNVELLNVFKSNENLMSLRLEGNFTEEFIERLSELEGLQELDLCSDRYTEQLCEGVQHISKLKKLQKFCLENFSFSTESLNKVLESCALLHTVELYQCSCLGENLDFSESLDKRMSVKTLKIIDSRMSPFESAHLLHCLIKKLDALECIEFKQMQIVDPDDGIYKELLSDLGKLQLLHTVSLKTNGVDYFTFVDSLDTLSTLKDITIYSDPKENNSLLQTAIRGFGSLFAKKRTFYFPSSLEKVCLGGRGVTQEVFDGLIQCCDQVRELTLTRIFVDEIHVRELAKFKKLKALHMIGIKMTSETISYLLQNLPSLESLHLDYLADPFEVNLQMPLPNLKKVNIRSGNTKESQFQVFKKILSSCPNLTDIGVMNDVERTVNRVIPSQTYQGSIFEQLEKIYPAVRFW